MRDLRAANSLTVARVGPSASGSSGRPGRSAMPGPGRTHPLTCRFDASATTWRRLPDRSCALPWPRNRSAQHPEVRGSPQCRCVVVGAPPDLVVASIEARTRPIRGQSRGALPARPDGADQDSLSVSTSVAVIGG